jgi:hypothetical protein
MNKQTVFDDEKRPSRALQLEVSTLVEAAKPSRLEIVDIAAAITKDGRFGPVSPFCVRKALQRLKRAGHKVNWADNTPAPRPPLATSTANDTDNGKGFVHIREQGGRFVAKGHAHGQAFKAFGETYEEAQLRAVFFLNKQPRPNAA